MTSTNRSVRARAGHPVEREESEETEREQGHCPECGADGVVDEKRGETVCRECGVVFEEGHVDRGPEWRSFDARDKAEKSRVGSPTTEMLHDKGLSSVIDWQNKDAHVRKRDICSRFFAERVWPWRPCSASR